MSLLTVEKSNPYDLHILHFLGTYYKCTGEFSLAEKFLSQAKQLCCGKDSEIEQSCARQLFKMKYLKKIIQSMDIKKDGSDSRIKDLEQRLVELLPKAKNKFFDDAYHLALAYKCAGRWNEAGNWVEIAKTVAKTDAEKSECLFLAFAIKIAIARSSAPSPISGAKSQVANNSFSTASTTALSSSQYS